MASMRGAHQYRTICEVLREVCDLCQGPSHEAIAVRHKLVEAEGMAKRMSTALAEYNQKWDAGWWEKNPDYKADLERRLSTRYVTV